MGMSQQPFTAGATVSLAVTGTTGRVALSKARSQQVRVSAPAGGQIAFIKFGDVTVTAAVTDIPILPGTVELFSVNEAETYVAAITATSTQTLYITIGEGN